MADTLSKRLRRLSEMVEDHHDFARESVMLRNAAAELDRREARLTALEQYLTRYGKHTPLCATAGGYDYPCSCGLAAALKG